VTIFELNLTTLCGLLQPRQEFSVDGSWRVNTELYCSQDSLSVCLSVCFLQKDQGRFDQVKEVEMGLHVARMRLETRTKYWSKNLTGRDQSEDLGVDGKIKL
jgi:hypothetical protein